MVVEDGVAETLDLALSLVRVRASDRGGEESVKLIAQALGRAAFTRDWSQIQLVHEAAECRAEVELGALGAEGLGVQPSEHETGVGAVGQAYGWRGNQVERKAAVDALELTRSRPAVGKRGLNKDACHEAD